MDEIPMDEFITDLAGAMIASGSADLALPETERQRFAAIMKRLLALDALSLRAKAHALQRDHEHLFHDVKILTDLRPVFSSPDQPPEGMVVEYTLKLTFHDGSRHKELYMSLDEDDISRLRSALDRAVTKAASLKVLLEAKNIVKFAVS